MTRTDVMASSRPLTAGAAPMGRGSTSVLRRLAVIPAVLLAIALLGPGSALAAEGTSGYNQEPPKPGTTTTTTTPKTETTPSTGTSPSKESTTPTTTSKETAPEKTSTTPVTAAKAKALPFTGFDLRWSFGIGLLLMGAGLSIVFVQRHRRAGGR